jgi:Bacteriophage replication protein O
MPKTDLPPLTWDGFEEPNYTPVPDSLFDVLLPYLTDAELRVLLYLIRRTYGFKKRSDAVSLSQITNGIVKTDGTRLDSGAGISEAGAKRAIKGLVSKGIITAQRNRSARQGDTATTYTVRVSRGVLSDPRPRSEGTPPPVSSVPTGGTEGTPQETAARNSKDKNGAEPSEFSPLDEAVMRQLRLSPDEYRTLKAQKL